jgi:hypothetical protein
MTGDGTAIWAFPRRRHMVGLRLGYPASPVVPPHWGGAPTHVRLAKAWPALPFALGRVSKAASRRAARHPCSCSLGAAGVPDDKAQAAALAAGGQLER